jgi:hypothetical protein
MRIDLSSEQLNVVDYIAIGVFVLGLILNSWHW